MAICYYEIILQKIAICHTNPMDLLLNSCSRSLVLTKKKKIFKISENAFSSKYAILPGVWSKEPTSKI